MASKFSTITSTVDVESVDIPTMFEMSDEDYRDYVRGYGLMYVDHHDVLRSSRAAYPLATSREQLDILIDELTRLRDKLRPKSEP
jgi:hypothetical protein